MGKRGIEEENGKVRGQRTEWAKCIEKRKRGEK